MHDEVGQLVVIADLPGVRQQDVEIALHGDIMTIEAMRKDDSAHVHHYHRELFLPLEVDNTPIDVAFENGLLEVRLRPKAAGRKEGNGHGNMSRL